MASRYGGKEIPDITTTVIALSSFECCLNADRIPSSTPSTRLIARAVPISLIVFGIRFASALAIEPPPTSSAPRLPWTTWPSQVTYRSGSGLLSPSASLSFSTSRGFTSLPGRTRAEIGSPGARLAKVKVRRDTPRRIGTAMSSRRPIKRSISAFSVTAATGWVAAVLARPGTGWAQASTYHSQKWIPPAAGCVMAAFSGPLSLLLTTA